MPDGLALIREDLELSGTYSVGQKWAQSDSKIHEITRVDKNVTVWERWHPMVETMGIRNQNETHSIVRP
jgi:hypothetical protein